MSGMTNEKKWYEEGALPPDEYRKQVLAEPKRTLAQVVSSRTGSKNHFVPQSERRRIAEAGVQAEIIRFLQRAGWWVHKAKAVNLVGSQSRDSLRLAHTQKGVPDILACSPCGKFVAIEVKAPKANVKVNADQIVQIDRIRATRGHAFVAHSIQCVERYLAESDNLTKKPRWKNH